MGLKITVKSTLNVDTVKQIQPAVEQSIQSAIRMITEDVATDLRAHISQRQRDWLLDRERDLLKQQPPVALIDSIRHYLFQLNAKVTYVGTWSSKILVEVDGDAMTDVGYSTRILSKLMEFGGHIVVGTTRYSLPPHPHWRTLVDAATRSAFDRSSLWMRRLMTEVHTRLSAIRPIPRL